MSLSGIPASIVASRDARPAHLQLEVKPYSKLVKTKPDKYETNSFESGGFNWKLVVYLTGKNVKDYVSVYLALDSTSNLQASQTIKVHVRFFLFNFKRGLYATFPDAHGKVQEFSSQNSEWGLDKMISTKDLEAKASGFLVNDKVAFGVEVFFIEHHNPIFEVLSLEDFITETKQWTINFSNDTGTPIIPEEEFSVGDRRWTIHFYPRGKNVQDEKYVAFYLVLADADEHPKKRPVYANFKLTIVNQENESNLEKEAKNWFSETNRRSGFDAFTTQQVLFKTPGYIVGQTCKLEARIPLVSMVVDE